MRHFPHWLCSSRALVRHLLRLCDRHQLKDLNQWRSRVQGQLNGDETMAGKEKRGFEGLEQPQLSPGALRSPQAQTIFGWAEQKSRV